MEGEVHRKDPSGKIITEPENWGDIVKKHEQREAENEQKVRERYKTTKDDDLLKTAYASIQKRANRDPSEHKHIKDRTIKYGPEDPTVLGLQKRLEEEIAEISKRTFQTSSESSEHADLKGRVSTQNPNTPAS